MRQFYFFILFIGFQCVTAQVFDKETIKNSGDNDKRINLVILSEGYKTSELAKFKTDATNFTTALFNQSPFKEYANYFNVHIVKVPSNESGADHPKTAFDEGGYSVPFNTVDTYFNATFDAFGYHRYLFYGIDYAGAASAEMKIISVLANNFPTYDQALLLVNTTTYGGTGGEFPMASLSGYDLAIHELGHSLFNLKDEYYGGDVYVGEAINMTQETNPNLVKWKNWMATSSVGIYPHGASGIAATWYKPSNANCKMELLNKPFCAVCKEGMVEKIHSIMSPIESFLPVSNTVASPSFPLDFQLNLIKPIPNTLKSKWTLNTVDFATDVDAVSILETDLSIGMNTLTVAVNDETTLLKVNNHDTFHLYTVTWTIDKTLGIEAITSETANYNISIFPNPSNSIINFKVESDTDTNLKVDIIGFDGKLIKSVLIPNYQTQQVDISNLSNGIYLTNFYSKNVLIATKKLVVK